METLEIVRSKIEDATAAAWDEAISRAERIAIITHKSPDSDAIGSMLGLTLTLQRLGKNVTPIDIDGVPEMFRFMPGWQQVQQDLDPAAFDTIIVIDCGDPKQTGFAESKPEIFAPAGQRPHFLIKIDHHAYAREFGDLQLVYTDMPASAFIVAELLRKLGIDPKPDAATNLLSGLMTDTGSLRHSNSSSAAHRLAAYLLRCGAQLAPIRRNIFQHTPIEALRLWGRVLKNLNLNQKGIAVTAIRQRDFEETGATAEDLAGVVDYVNAVPGALFSLMLSERGDLIKGSLRTKRDDVDVAKIASAFGGGGHVKAAGFAVPGRLEQETVWRIVSDKPETESASF